MWDALTAEQFLASCSALSKRAIARAVIGYCDGSRIRIYVGDVAGTLADKPRGSRQFYWDTVFAPDALGGKTYAEVAGAGGLVRKVQISQSVRALMQFMAFREKNSPPLFPDL
jgi:inosine/xanthosine triphosphate pyrophosphatase family protein